MSTRNGLFYKTKWVFLVVLVFCSHLFGPKGKGKELGLLSLSLSLMGSRSISNQVCGGRGGGGGG